MRFGRKKPAADEPAAAAPRPEVIHLPDVAQEPAPPARQRPDPALGLAVKRLREGGLATRPPSERPPMVYPVGSASDQSAGLPPS
jgi:hypothetical protein